jgi:hypothetical protein
VEASSGSVAVQKDGGTRLSSMMNCKLISQERDESDCAEQNNRENNCPRGFLGQSLDAAPLDMTWVGTICFDGNGNILGSSMGFNQTGWFQTLNGSTLAAVTNQTGTYNINGAGNTPGQGMGYFTFKSQACGQFEFSVNSVDSTAAVRSPCFATAGTPTGCQPSVPP